MILHTDASELCKGKYIIGYTSHDALLKANMVVSCSNNNDAEVEAVRFALGKFPEAEIHTDSEHAVRHFASDNVKHVGRNFNMCNNYLRVVKYTKK